MTVFEPTAKINRVPCWGMRFFDENDDGTQGDELLVASFDHHTAEIDLSLQGGLTAGRLAAKIGRLRADDFGKLAEKTVEDVERGDGARAGKKRLFVQVAMYWKDPIVPAREFSDDLVIETFRVTKLAREVDGLDVVTLIEGRRALFDRISLAQIPGDEGPMATDTLDAVKVAMEAAGFADGTDFQIYPDTGEAAPNPQRLKPSVPLAQTLAKLRRQMMNRPPRRRGRALYLIRKNKLHVGPFRPIPHDGEKELNAAVGLISVKNNGATRTLGSGDTTTTVAPEERTKYTLRLAGRMDLQPGDVVSFKPPSESGNLFGGFGLPSPPAGLPGIGGDDTVKLYVSDVSQKLSKTAGWITTASGVSVSGEMPDAAWDIAHDPDGEEPEDEEDAEPGSAGARINRAVGRRINHAFATRPVTSIGEVRDYAVETTETNGVIQTAAHSSTILRGIENLGGPRQARLDPIIREPADMQANVPYVTNFAWGPFGHVLPRYPGMRVMTLNNRRDKDDPVEIGALWKTSDTEASSAPTNTAAGDWWLILPAYGDGDPPSAPTGTDPVPPGSDVKASHDLITAKGERAIEVNGFVVRSFEGGSLMGPSDRPAVMEGDTDKGGILIEQVDGGSTIRMLKDGTVEIVTGADLTITGGGAITVDATDDLTLTGANVNLVAKDGTVDAS